MKRLRGLLILVFILGSQQSMAAQGVNLAKEKAQLLKACRYLGPWKRAGDSDFCSCLTGHSLHLVRQSPDFKVSQVSRYLLSLARLKYQRARNPKTKLQLIPIQDASTRAKYKHVSLTCERDPGFKNTKAFTTISSPVQNSSDFYADAAKVRIQHRRD